eukprot:TRINITY_DN5093_c0_g2_i1.p1 TRINITY_DN5093_c0_g2~~TRINITY_DN5093_c0_g2_i1.p1  ORF type:complete len:259 (+),score=26.11 TRINITY_DN5093_c0_g2_i1:1104-1880(+)
MHVPVLFCFFQLVVIFLLRKDVNRHLVRNSGELIAPLDRNYMRLQHAPRCVILFGVLGVVALAFVLTSGSQRGSFQGAAWRTPQTVSAVTVAESKFARCELHTVRTESGKIINDWLWFDEADAVNILVQNTDGDFVLFNQVKYGIPKPTLALLGGMIEPQEDPLQAAKRELLEELSLTSSEWVNLGTYRVAANRGGGHISCFLAKMCVPSSEKAADDDLETRDIVTLSPSRLRELLLSGEIGEVKWTATAALALLHLQ